MTALIALISFLVTIAILILAHEFGHFITAKASGIKVEEFGLGYPPRIFGIRRGETLYSINALPLGGFTRMSGEEDPKKPRSLASKSVPTRLLVLSAGSLMNLLLPLLLFSVAFMIPHNTLTGQVKVEQVAAGSPAAAAGIMPGDIITAVNGNKLTTPTDLQRYIQLNLGNRITIELQHPDSTVSTVEVVPRWKPPEGQGAVGIATTIVDPQIVRKSYPFWQAIPMGVRDAFETFILFKNGIVGMFTGTTPVAVTGPVGIAQLTGEVARAGISPLLEFAAFLSINLAIFNLFPLPGLDGGRIVFVLIEWFRRGKRISPRVEALVHGIGFLLLIGAVIAITYRDILRIIAGESIIP